MRGLIFGAGNLLYADEGIGVHLVNYLEEHYTSEAVEFFDAGTLGLMAAHKFEDAEVVIIVDALEMEGETGSIHLYDGDDIRANSIPVKLSPHQLGLQEMLMICEMRGHTPDVVKLVGVIPDSMETGSMELSEKVQKILPNVADEVIKLLKDAGLEVTPK